jgi:hypothetical protein
MPAMVGIVAMDTPAAMDRALLLPVTAITSNTLDHARHGAHQSQQRAKRHQRLDHRQALIG